MRDERKIVVLVVFSDHQLVLVDILEVEALFGIVYVLQEGWLVGSTIGL